MRTKFLCIFLSSICALVLLSGNAFGKTIFFADNAGDIYFYDADTNILTSKQVHYGHIIRMRYFPAVKKIYYLSLGKIFSAGYIDLKTFKVIPLEFPKEYEYYHILISSELEGHNNIILFTISKKTIEQMEYENYTKEQYLNSLIYLIYDFKANEFSAINLTEKEYDKKIKYLETPVPKFKGKKDFLKEHPDKEDSLKKYKETDEFSQIQDNIVMKRAGNEYFIVNTITRQEIKFEYDSERIKIFKIDSFLVE